MKNFKKIIAVSLISLATVSCNTKDKNQREMENNKELNAIFPQGEKGSKDLFTGNAYNIGLVDADSVFTTAVGNVYFEPGARSN